MKTYPMGTMRASLRIREMESSERIAISEYDLLKPTLLDKVSRGKGVRNMKYGDEEKRRRTAPPEFILHMKLRLRGLIYQINLTNPWGMFSYLDM
jgi:hypothetical protein